MGRREPHRRLATICITLSHEHLLWVAKHSALVGLSPSAFVSEFVEEAIDASPYFSEAPPDEDEAQPDDPRKNEPI